MDAKRQNVRRIRHIDPIGIFYPDKLFDESAADDQTPLHPLLHRSTEEPRQQQP
jgi:hypothetical protein